MSHLPPVPSEGVLEACYPIGDKWHTTEEKRKAVRLVQYEGYSYGAAAREIKASRNSVIAWCSEFDMRAGRVQAWLVAAGAIF